MKKYLFVVFYPLIVLLIGCASNVAVDYELQTDFNKLKQFKILSPTNIATDDTRLNSSIVIKRFERLIQEYLKQRNYQVSNNPDFYVTYQLQSKQEVKSDNSGFSFGFGRGWGHSRGGFGMIYTFPDNEVYSYDKAIVTIDILDANKQLIWRGSSSQSMDNTSSPEKNEQNAGKIIEEILEKFPPEANAKT